MYFEHYQTLNCPDRGFLDGEKEWEMRGVNGVFNPRNVKKGRTVEIRRGYKDNPIWGIITPDFQVINI